MAYRKRTNEEIQESKEKDVALEDFVEETKSVVQEESKSVEKEAAKESVKKKTEHEPTELIKCRSVVQGVLLFKGPKSQTDYRWDAANDIVEIEYQDLRAARVSKHAFLTRGYFIIEDNDLLDEEEWAEVKKKYGEMYSRKDLTAIFKIDDVNAMVRAIQNLPDGVRAQMGSIAKGLMDNGQLDSIKKITALDKLLGTDLMLFATDRMSQATQV